MDDRDEVSVKEQRQLLAKVSKTVENSYKFRRLLIRCWHFEYSTKTAAYHEEPCLRKFFTRYSF